MNYLHNLSKLNVPYKIESHSFKYWFIHSTEWKTPNTRLDRAHFVQAPFSFDFLNCTQCRGGQHAILQLAKMQRPGLFAQWIHVLGVAGKLAKTDKFQLNVPKQRRFSPDTIRFIRTYDDIFLERHMFPTVPLRLRFIRKFIIVCYYYIR